MNRTKRIVLGLSALMLALVGRTQELGQQKTIDLPVNQATPYKGEEFLLMGSATRGAGEPVIAIDPKDPNNIIVGAMANLNYVEGETWDLNKPFGNAVGVIKYRNTPGASISSYAISHDRGRTWRFFDDQFRDYYKMNGTADAFVGAGADGALFIGAMNFFPQNASPLQLQLEKEPDPGLLYGNIDLSSSTDGGKTWSKPSHVMGQATPLEEYGPGVKPHLRGKTPYDRPFLTTDLSTGTIYIPGHGTGGEPVHGEAFFRASKDNGMTWGPVYSYDSADYPEGGGVSKPAAANGVLGMAYVATTIPASTGTGKCPCLVFETSRDDGKTFERNVVKYEMPVSRNFGGAGIAAAADASHPAASL